MSRAHTHTRAHAFRSPRICGSPRRRDSKANLEKGLPRGFGQSGRSRARRGCDPLRVHGKSFAGEKPSASSFLDLVSEFFPKGLTKFLSACHLTVNHPPGDQPSKFYSCFVFSYYMYVCIRGRPSKYYLFSLTDVEISAQRDELTPHLQNSWQSLKPNLFHRSHFHPLSPRGIKYKFIVLALEASVM